MTTLRGKQIRLTKAKKDEGGKITAKTIAEAKKEAKKELHRLLADLPPEASPSAKAAFKQIANAFLEESQKANAPDTYRGHKRFLKSFCRFLHSPTYRVEDLKPYQAYRWVGLHETWGDSTRRVALSVVQACLNWGVKQGYISDHPLKALEKPPAAAREEFVTPEQQEKIFGHLRTTDPFRDFVFAMQQTGCRPSEVARVAAEDCDLEAGVWVLQKHKTRKKTGKPRVIVLNAAMLDLTKRLVKECGGKGPIFRNRDNRPWKRSGIGYRLRKLAEELNIPGLSSYLYRHAFITIALERGLTDTVVAELCGNSPVTIRRHYTHLNERLDFLRSQAEKATQSSK
jgi:integrase